MALTPTCYPGARTSGPASSKASLTGLCRRPPAYSKEQALRNTVRQVRYATSSTSLHRLPCCTPWPLLSSRSGRLDRSALSLQHELQRIDLPTAAAFPCSPDRRFPGGPAAASDTATRTCALTFVSAVLAFFGFWCSRHNHASGLPCGSPYDCAAGPVRCFSDSFFRICL